MLVFPEKWTVKSSSFGHFNSHFVLKHLCILVYWEKKTHIENKQSFDGIIDVTLFDGVEGLDYRE